jgi:S-adenosyl-L-methionine hydrolase (adenosine-forming)
MAPPVTLLTDFGTRDGYVAAMRGIIAALAPNAVVDDASHDIPPGDVRAAAFALSRYWKRYPNGTVHVVVVDPGVGSQRRALAINADDRFLVGPDNGVLSQVIRAASYCRIVHITRAEFLPDEVSATFHGRDIFAPVAAQLARGGQIDSLGPTVSDPVMLELPMAVASERRVRGEIVYVDRFGNLISNIPAVLLIDGLEVKLEGHSVGTVRRTYSEANSGDPLAIVNSDGVLEIAVRDGRADDVLRAGRGALVELS